MSPALRTAPSDRRRSRPPRKARQDQKNQRQGETVRASLGPPPEELPLDKRSRHSLSTVQQVHLELVFRQNTHPSTQQKKEIAQELDMDCKTVTTWFRNKRRTAKRVTGSPLRRGSAVEESTCDTCLLLRSVLGSPTSPSHDLSTTESDAQVRTPSGNREEHEDLQSRPYPKRTCIQNQRICPYNHAQAPYTVANVAGQVDDPQATDNSVSRKRMLTLEWACEQQTRRHSSSEAKARPPKCAKSATSPLPSTLSVPQRPPEDAVQGAFLLLYLKYSAHLFREG